MKKIDVTSILTKQELEEVLELGNLKEHQYKSEKKNLIGLLLQDGNNYNMVILSQTNGNDYRIFNMRKGFSIIDDAVNSINYQFRWYTEGLGKERLSNFQNQKLQKKEMSKTDQKLLAILKLAKAEYTDDNLVIPIPKFLSKKFTTFCAIRDDLNLIKNYASKLPTERDNTICSALTFSMISLYGKCFTDATSSKSPKLEPNEIFKGEPKFQTIHDKLLNLRHNFIAHRGESEGEVKAAFMLIPKVDNGGVEIKYKGLKQISFSKQELSEIEDLIDFILKKLQPKIDKSARKVKEGLLNNFNPKQIAFMNLNSKKE